MSASAAPGEKLLLQVRTDFILQGTTLTAWCRSHRIHTSNARQALLGSWNGAKGKALREKLLKASKADAKKRA
jgi:hypothetical protein